MDHPVPLGEVGEVCVSGPLLSGGYWHLPEETAKTFKDGWGGAPETWPARTRTASGSSSTGSRT